MGTYSTLVRVHEINSLSAAVITATATLAIADAVDLTDTTWECSYNFLCASDGNSLAGSNRWEAGSLVTTISICLFAVFVSVQVMM
jgi:hypothetical protein